MLNFKTTNKTLLATVGFMVRGMFPGMLSAVLGQVVVLVSAVCRRIRGEVRPSLSGPCAPPEKRAEAADDGYAYVRGGHYTPGLGSGRGLGAGEGSACTVWLGCGNGNGEGFGDGHHSGVGTGFGRGHGAGDDNKDGRGIGGILADCGYGLGQGNGCGHGIGGPGDHSRDGAGRGRGVGGGYSDGANAQNS